MFSEAQMSVLAYPCFCLHLRLASQQLQLATCLQLTEYWGAGRHQDEAEEIHRQAYQSPRDTLNSLLDALLAATILRSCRLQPPCITPLVTTMTCLACFAAVHTDTACGPKEAFPTYCKSSCCEPLACTSCRLDVPGGGKSAEELAGLLFCSCCCCSEFDGSINRLLGDINDCKVSDQSARIVCVCYPAARCLCRTPQSRILQVLHKLQISQDRAMSSTAAEYLRDCTVQNAARTSLSKLY